MQHVLFVDDDPSVLSGLRRMTHTMRSQWRMTFVADGDAALVALDGDPADVMVVDMRMRGMDGATLLAEVRRRWPQTVRIVLSGFSDQGAALRSIPVAHRFLAKPCDPATLLATVQSGYDLRARLSRPELRSVVGGLGSLPSAPRSYAAITDALGQPDVCLEAVASIIERDASSSAKLLQLVNSAFFGLARNVSRVRDAVAYLGISRVRDVVLAAEVADMFRCTTPGLASIAQDVNEYSVAIAGAAREWADPKHAHDAFVAGVLHDIGRLVLASVVPVRYLPIYREHRASGSDLAVLETERLGAAHAEVGAYLLQLWGLPFTLVEAVARHHDPDAVTDVDPIVAAVAVAVAGGDGSEVVDGPESEVDDA